MEPQRLPPGRPQSARLEPDIGRDPLDGGQGDGRDVRAGEDHLGEDDGPWGVQQLQRPEGPGP